MSNRFLISIIIILFGLLISSNSLLAQPALEWEMNYGGTNFERAQVIKQTLDKGYITASENNLKEKFHLRAARKASNKEIKIISKIDLLQSNSLRLAI